MRKPILPPVKGVIRLAVVLAVAGVVTAFPMPGNAEDSIRVVDSRVTAEFPLFLTFHLEAQGPTDITRAEVRFRVDQRSCAQAESSGLAQLQPGKQVSTEWKWDTRKGGTLPPGAVVRYRWILRDASGQGVETPEQAYEAVDHRHAWQSLQSGPLSLSWYQGDMAFATSLMRAAEEAQRRLEVSMRARPERPIKLFIYGSAQDLRGALVFPEEWTGGVSFGGFNIIAIGISPSDKAWGERALAHELTHVVVDQVTFNCLQEVPTWLHEGLATFNEDASGTPLPAYAEALKAAVAAGRLISVRGISGSFPTAAKEAVLAYGESFSLVRYLTERNGPERLGALLAVLRTGTPPDAALRQVYGFDQDGLEGEWRRHIGAPPMPQATSGQRPAPPVPTVPTFAPYTLSPPVEDPTGMSTSPTATWTVTPAPQSGKGAGCTAGLVPIPGATSPEAGGVALLLVLPMMATVALLLRTRR